MDVKATDLQVGMKINRDGRGISEVLEVTVNRGTVAVKVLEDGKWQKVDLYLHTESVTVGAL